MFIMYVAMYSQYVANYFLTWLANSANHIFRIILHLYYDGIP